MKKNLFRFLCLSLLALSYLFVFTTGRSQAQTEDDAEAKPQARTYSFPGVSVFTTSAGRFGFFEQGTGRIYLYDSNLSTCIFTGQMTALGEPIEEIK